MVSGVPTPPSVQAVIPRAMLETGAFPPSVAPLLESVQVGITEGGKIQHGKRQGRRGGAPIPSRWRGLSSEEVREQITALVTQSVRQLLDDTEADKEVDSTMPLMEMGFPEARCKKALLITGNDSVEHGIQWLTDHVEDPLADAPLTIAQVKKALKPKLTPEEKAAKAAELQRKAKAEREKREALEAVDREKRKRGARTDACHRARARHTHSHAELAC